MITIVTTLDGQPLAASDSYARALAISLFTWRRAQDGDPVDGAGRQGWWADGIEPSMPSGIGSRMWLLARRKLDAQTMHDAEDYTREALQWWLDQRVASIVDVTVARVGDEAIVISVAITLRDGRLLVAEIKDLWSLINV
jgi:phage gp46-like protein